MGCPPGRDEQHCVCGGIAFADERDEQDAPKPEKPKIFARKHLQRSKRAANFTEYRKREIFSFFGNGARRARQVRRTEAQKPKIFTQKHLQW